MRKWIKGGLIVLILLIVCIIIDIVSIYTRSEPIFAIKDKYDDQVYRGLLYDTYNCQQFSVSQIYPKWVKYICNKNAITGKITSIENNYVVITANNNNPYINKGDEAYILLDEHIKINGSSNLIIGQCIEITPTTVEETYPVRILTETINIVLCNNNVEIMNIIDESEVCAEALEEIYKDDEYTYYLPCIKSEMIKVIYSDNTELTLKKAFENSRITISDLDKFNIQYYKE